ADQPDGLEVGVEEVLEHDSVTAGALVGAEAFGGLVDGSDDAVVGVRSKPVVERLLPSAARIELVRALPHLLTRLPDEQAGHDTEAQRPRLLPDRRRVPGRDERRVVLVGEPECRLDRAPPASPADEQPRARVPPPPALAKA